MSDEQIRQWNLFATSAGVVATLVCIAIVVTILISVAFPIGELARTFRALMVLLFVFLLPTTWVALTGTTLFAMRRKLPNWFSAIALFSALWGLVTTWAVFNQ